MKKYSAAIALTLSLGALVFIVEAAPQPSAPRGGGRLTIEQLIDIRHPSNPVWSPDGRHVAFLSERAGIANIFVADVAAASTAPAGARALTRYADGQGGGFFWSADSTRVYFARQRRSLAGRGRAAASRPRSGRRRRRRTASRRRQTARASRSSGRSVRQARAGRRSQAPRRPRVVAEAVAAARGGDLMVRTLADGHGVAGAARRRPRDRRPELVAGRQGDRVQRQQPHDSPRADAGVLRLEDHLHDQRERAGRDRRGQRGRHRDEDARLGRRLRRTPLAGRGALPGRAHLAGFQEAHDVGGRASPAASRRCCTRKWRTSSGASPAMRARSRRRTASGSPSSAIATAGITST